MGFFDPNLLLDQIIFVLAQWVVAQPLLYPVLLKEVGGENLPWLNTASV